MAELYQIGQLTITKHLEKRRRIHKGNLSITSERFFCGHKSISYLTRIPEQLKNYYQVHTDEQQDLFEARMTSDELKVATEALDFWETLQKFGGAAVVIGVALELSGHLMASPIQKKVDDYRNTEIARLNAESKGLEYQLVQERQKRAPRAFTEDQRSQLIASFTANAKRINKVNIFVQRDLESKWYAFQLGLIFHESKIPYFEHFLPPGEILAVPAGLLLYIPGGKTNEDDLKTDPIYVALKASKLFGGTASRPWLSIEGARPDSPTLPLDEYTIYVGQKMP